MWGMMHSVSKADFIKMTIKTLEMYLSIAAEQAQKFGQKASKVVCVMDMENFNIRQYAWRPGKYHRILNITGANDTHQDNVIFMAEYEVNTNYSGDNHNTTPTHNRHKQSPKQTFISFLPNQRANIWQFL
jgi:lantibiotic modifying enzyme